ncbi:MAG: UTP--glucose-1-phosphate uridylyltransferase [Bacilli bacterium]|nr:UTP--glucose-1-phosphate uridylyltransferase [Bacilli bacterium]MDD4283053.1 UTP--glucose-1-phosphate uridylyltransferase [Bacilli bacterium]MDD4719133.1 UTP--glucose-1-phosphate uridylyltransferase [Bacilli bacterium]
MLDSIKIKLHEHGQEHLLNFYEELSENEKKHLINQIESIDFDLIKNLMGLIGKKKDAYEFSSMSSYLSVDEDYKLGLNSILKGEYALVTMAGGQGTRLGFDGPKGTYILKNGINKSLFEIQCDKLKNLYKMSNVYIPWYIMTSLVNNDETVDFFEKNNYFDYPKDKIQFFTQDELPMIDLRGKIVMDSKSNIKMGANGSGGVFSGLTKSGILNEMKKNKIKWVFIGGIDNILLPVDNPDLIGFAIKNNYLVTSKIVPKVNPDEKVGVFGYRNNRPSVIEYIEMDDEKNNLRDESGQLLYRDIHTISNVFNISVLENIADKELEYVPAFKKTEYINEEGNLIIPDSENAYKFETFIFEAFSYVNEVGLIQGKREEIFAPIKNAKGVDSPETASKLYKDFYKNKN